MEKILHRIPIILACLSIVFGVQAKNSGAKNDYRYSAKSELLSKESKLYFDTPIPGKVEAENWSSKYGVETQATTDIGGGLNSYLLIPPTDAVEQARNNYGFIRISGLLA